MKQCLRDKCLFYYHKNDRLCGLLIFHVDDFLNSGNDEFEKDIILPLRQKYSFGKISHQDFTFTGLHLTQNKNYEIFVDQNDFAAKMDLYDYRKQEN